MRIIKQTLNIIRLSPHIIIYFLYKEKLNKDVKHWCNCFNIDVPQTGWGG